MILHFSCNKLRVLPHAVRRVAAQICTRRSLMPPLVSWKAKVSPPKMASQSESEIGINSWLEDELYQQYLHDHSTVDESWKQVFEEPRPTANGAPPPAPAAWKHCDTDYWHRRR